MVARIWGSGASKAFAYESGQHVVQRIPPTEKNSRKQTSIVSVAVMPLPPEKTLKPLSDSEVEITCTTGTGPGGQHRNKTASCVRAKHKRTGLEVVIDSRDQHQNRKIAMRILTARVNELYHSKQQAEYDSQRRQRLGDGARGTKIRTYNFLESRAVDHRFGKKTKNIKGVMRGEFQLLLP